MKRRFWEQSHDLRSLLWVGVIGSLIGSPVFFALGPAFGGYALFFFALWLLMLVWAIWATRPLR